jgi:hypothetical protein
MVISSITPVPKELLPISLLVDIDVDIVGDCPSVEVIGPVAYTLLTPGGSIQANPVVVVLSTDNNCFPDPTGNLVSAVAFLVYKSPLVVNGEVNVPELNSVPPDKVNPSPIIISSITPIPAVLLPISLLVFILVEITGVLPPEEVIGDVAVTDVTAEVKYVLLSKVPLPFTN